MNPYYSDEYVTIYNADSRDVLGELNAHALITDPPYGVELTAKTGRVHVAQTTYQDDAEHVRELIHTIVPLALTRVERGLIFPGHTMLFEYPTPDAIGSVWLPNGIGMCAWGFQCASPILFYGKCPYLADGKGGRPNGFVGGQPSPEIDHPCPKPLRWMQWAVLRATREHESVIDPFMGSGTTLRAAKDLGRHAIGIDIVERYCEVAAERMAQGVLPFDAPTTPTFETIELFNDE